MASWRIINPSLRKQNYQTKWCHNFIMRSACVFHQRWASERLKGKLRGEWDIETEGGRLGRWWEKKTSCWFVQFDWSHEGEVTGETCLLMHTVWTTDLVSTCTNAHTDIGLGHPEMSTLLSKWHVIVTVAVVTGNMNDLSHVHTAGISTTPEGNRRRMSWLSCFSLI